MATVFLTPKTKEVFTCMQYEEWIKITVLVVSCRAIREQTSQESMANHCGVQALLGCPLLSLLKFL